MHPEILLKEEYETDKLSAAIMHPENHLKEEYEILSFLLIKKRMKYLESFF